jgi:HK97 family phage major capsid protein/HK97 family phage prohead protease
MDRAYSLITIKAVDESGDARVITGMATTPEPDRYGDVVEPLGVKFTNPLPLLHQHQADKPVGSVKFGKPTKDGIPFTATLPVTAEPPSLKDRIDVAWGEVKSGLVRAVSIGFRPLEYAWMEGGGIHFIETEVMELSLVTIPANTGATIQTIKSFDAELRAASGRSDLASRPKPPASRATPPQTRGSAGKMTLQEQITALEAKRVAKAARLEALATKAATDGVTLDEAEGTEFDDIEAEIAGIDVHLKRLSSLERINAQKAAPVVGHPANGGGNLHAGRIEVKAKALPKGTAFTRYAIALALSKGNVMHAEQIAARWNDSTPEVAQVLKAAVAAGTTTDATWAAPLVDYQNMTAEFIELLRPATLLGRIPGLRMVPFNISMPRQTAGSTVGWVGDGRPKPVSALAFDNVTLRWAKAAGIVVLTEELVRFSNPAAEQVVRQDLIDTIRVFLDVQFLDPAVAAVSNVSPASITNGVTPIPASGTTVEHARVDGTAAMQAMLVAGIGLSGAVWLMDEITAAILGGAQNALGQPEFPGLSPTGGNWLGLPVITTEAVPPNVISTESPPLYPAGRIIVLVKPSEIMLADDGQVMLDVSREATLQMDSAPTHPVTASQTLVSLWQHNMIGVRAERWINWLRRRSGAVQYIAGVAYQVTTPA